MDVLIRIALLGLLCQIGFCLRMVNVDDMTSTAFIRMVKQGDNVVLKCREVFEAADENFGVNPLKWHKTQIQENKEDPELGIEVTSFGSVHGVFEDTTRFTATFNQNTQENTLDVNLVIDNIQSVDSGWYFCYSKKGQEVKFIRYEVQVYVPPGELVLTGKPTPDANVSHSDPLTFYADQTDGSLECTAVGGYPAPTLRIHIDGEDQPLTGFGTPATSYYLQGQPEGLQQILYNTSVTVRVQVRQDQNGRKVICRAVADSGSGDVVESPRPAMKTLSVHYKPKIRSCDRNWKSSVGKTSVNFSCFFESNPAPDVTWKALREVPATVIAANGTVVNDLYSAELRVTSQKDAANMSVFQTILSLKRITDDSFHKYIVRLENDRGFTEEEFVLNKDTGVVTDDDGNPDNSAGMFSSSSLLLFILVTLAASILRQ